jgi:hypothetical protein
MLLLLWILWLLLGNDKSALNPLAFADILQTRFVEKAEVFKLTKITLVTYLISYRLATIKLVESEEVIYSKKIRLWTL